ncbi:MAG: flagellar basal body P-ring protein FlgI [Phycisphaerales bacterium]|nr:flagellar basal body P-ring protein FlgI [Phycisphaerales bacterium]
MNARSTIPLIATVALAAQFLQAQTGPIGGARPSAPPSFPADDPAAEPRLTADNVSIQDLARIQGQGESVLRGVGIVTGLAKGKGDKGSEMVLARPLAAIYEANHIPVPELKEFANASSCALVMIEVKIPAQGARQDDPFDIRVTTLHSASDLSGGQLMLAPLMGPNPADPTVYAMGSGTIMLEDKSLTTNGVIKKGAHMVVDVPMPVVAGSSFVLTLHPQYRSYTVASRVADAVNGSVNDPQEGLALTDRSIHTDVAKALDDTSIRVTIPPNELANVPQFIAMVMSTQVTLSLLQQPAEVRINPRTGTIVCSGNVEISPVAINLRNLTINALIPALPPSPQNPQRFRESTVGLDTSSRAREKARIQDLIAAFRALDVPFEDRMNVFIQLSKSGRLHARLVVE